RTLPVSDRSNLAAALSRLLAGTGYRAERAGRGYRIVRARIAPAPPRPKRKPAPAPPPKSENADEIVVEANKQRVPLLRYPGSLTTLR
ncbi:secretin and TonB N-terminal domain-containing protein, partial [Vibrio parahaemolyticus]